MFSPIEYWSSSHQPTILLLNVLQHCKYGQWQSSNHTARHGGCKVPRHSWLSIMWLLCLSTVPFPLSGCVSQRCWGDSSLFKIIKGFSKGYNVRNVTQLHCPFSNNHLLLNPNSFVPSSNLKIKESIEDNLSRLSVGFSVCLRWSHTSLSKPS